MASGSPVMHFFICTDYVRYFDLCGGRSTWVRSHPRKALDHLTGITAAVLCNGLFILKRALWLDRYIHCSFICDEYSVNNFPFFRIQRNLKMVDYIFPYYCMGYFMVYHRVGAIPHDILLDSLDAHYRDMFFS